MKNEQLPVAKKTSKAGGYRLLGYRAVVELVKEDVLRDSWLWTPASANHKYRAAIVVQCGTYTKTKKRPPLEFKRGDKVVIDGNYGAQELVDGNRKFLVVSAHDVAAILDSPSDNPATA